MSLPSTVPTPNGHTTEKPSEKPLRKFTLGTVTKATKALRPRAMLHAKQKWGKTSFAAHFPNCIFLCTRGEDGLETLVRAGQLHETPHFPDMAATYADVNLAIDELIREDHNYEWFVIDTWNGVERLMIEALTAQFYDNDPTKFQAYGAGNTHLGVEMPKLVSKLETLRQNRNMGIILLAHSRVKTFSNPEGDNYDRWEPVLNKESLAVIDRWADMILFGNFEVHGKKANKTDTKVKALGGEQRILCTRHHAAYDAGNRFGLPEIIECGSCAEDTYKNFVAAMKAAKEPK